MPGIPRHLPDGRLLTHSDEDGMRRLLLDDAPITPPDLQVRSVIGTYPHSDGDERILFTANDLDAPTELHVWSVDADGEPTALTTEPGVRRGRSR